MSSAKLFLKNHRNEVNYFNYYYYTNAFTDQEILDIIKLGEKEEIYSAVTGSNDTPTSYRTSDISWVDETNDSYWLYEKIANYAMEANKIMWNFDIWGYQDSFQYTIYDAAEEGHYDWHADCGPNMSNRKLSCVLQLTNPSEYTGGDLELNVGSNVMQVPKAKGLLTFFPSFILHRVSPLKSGVRRSLVTWLAGANLR